MTNKSVNKRNCLSVYENDEIIHELEWGEKNVSKKFNLPSSTVVTLGKNKETILSVFEKNVSTNKKDKKMLV